jgi:RimJ/RimL family protein N-acetyltransferase
MIHLEPFSENDFDTFKTFVSNQEELTQFAGPGFTWPISNKQLEKYINDPCSHPYKVVYNENDKIIGHCELYIPEGQMPKLCRIIIGDKSYRGRGLGSLIVKELLKIAFEITDSDKAELNVYDWNLSAFNCYRKCGFVVNPAKQKTIFVKGKKWVSLNMVISKNSFVGNE